MIADGIASGRSREDRLPCLLVSKQERARHEFCIRAGIDDQEQLKEQRSIVGGPKFIALSQTERGNAVPLRHLSLAAVVEIAEHLQAKLLKKKGVDKYTAAVYVLDSQRSHNSIGLNLWELPQKRIEDEEDWNRVIDDWDSAKAERVTSAAKRLLTSCLKSAGIYATANHDVNVKNMLTSSDPWITIRLVSFFFLFRRHLFILSSSSSLFNRYCSPLLLLLLLLLLLCFSRYINVGSSIF